MKYRNAVKIVECVLLLLIVKMIRLTIIIAFISESFNFKYTVSVKKIYIILKFKLLNYNLKQNKQYKIIILNLSLG